ncbi:PAS domain-containing protein [Altererythrobacter indicus]|uniref:histidine kinase n=2 Tax=Altericroceibacterium indicum TaxID=374177 RepID=A0A845AAF4_9SPHN|nr:PAS domain-containing protein [Altericroceibacterium indicum]
MAEDQAHRVEFDGGRNYLSGMRAEEGFSSPSGVLFEQAMAQTRMAVCLCDPKQPHLPIVFSNRAFHQLTGYSEAEVSGRSCNILQGPGTDPVQVGKVRKALRHEDVVVVELLNYRKDGSEFWNALHLGPIYDANGELLYFFGSQWDVSDVRAARAEEQNAKMMARELSHRMKNMFSVISGIVNITGRVRHIETEASEINGRIQALGRAYETTLDEASTGSIEIGQAIRAILEPYDSEEGRLHFLGNGLRVPFQIVSLVGMVLHELAANAMKHGAWSDDEGSVAINWFAREDALGVHLEVTWVEKCGPTVQTLPPGEKPKSGTGDAIVERLLRHSGGKIERNWNKQGLDALVTVPLREKI